MLTQNIQLTNFVDYVAQLEGDPSEAESAEAPPLSAPGISLSDTTRLGPYSVLLKDAFEESQTEQRLSLNESPPDVVAIARSLTPQEKSQGLSQQLVTREKIALIVDVNNPFQGTLTLKQVAGIFAGEITNWSQLGGSDRPLKLVHRPAQNLTRQALQGYGLSDQSPSQNTVDSESDTTAAIVQALGSDGISYAPASETIEQFNTRVITIDNVDVSDGRYPFSQPLNYAFQTQPKPEVQDFLEFLKSPDAQAAIEFAQSQPADPTRVLTQPELSALSPVPSTESAAEVDAPETSPSETPEISSTPENTSDPELSSEIPAVSEPPAVAPSPGGAWLPLLIIFVALGLLSWLTYMRVKLEKNRQKAPRPAPDYAARLNAQGSNRNRDELRAIADGPANAKAATPTTRLAKPDLSLDGVAPPVAEGPDEMSSKHEDGLDDDLTTLQSAPPEQGDPKVDPKVELQVELQVEPEFDDELLTTLQFAADSASPKSATAEPDLDIDADATVLQGVFEPELPADDAEMSAVEPKTVPAESLKSEHESLPDESLSDEPHRDPLTGQLTDELEALSELEAEAQATQEKLAQDKAAKQADSAPTHVEKANSSDTWDEVADPWD